MAETISFTYLGTNNDDLGPYHGLTMPATVTIADIPEAAEFSVTDSLEIFSFSNVDLSTLSQYGKGRVIASQTGELAGYELQFRYLRQNGDSFTQSGPMFILDGDDLVAGDTTAEAATGMGVSAQTGFQLRVTKVAKATTGPGSGTGTGGCPRRRPRRGPRRSRCRRTLRSVSRRVIAVSYTHLTLPTSDLV